MNSQAAFALPQDPKHQHKSNRCGITLCVMDWKERRELLLALAQKRKAEERQGRIERFAQMQPFNTVDDIPDIPIMENKEDYEEIVVKNLIRCGAIPKDKLEVGVRYEGACRNATEAVWNGKQFEYKRYKFGDWMEARINHFQDDDGNDVFVPIKKI